MISRLLPDFNSSTLLHAESCCTIADKIYSKTKAYLIQFLWNLYSILYHKSRACISNFKPIQIDLITQTQTWTQLTQILQYRTYFNHLSYTSWNVNKTWNQLVWILSQDICPFKPLTRRNLMNISNQINFKLDYLSI